MARPKRFSALRNWLNGTTAGDGGESEQEQQQEEAPAEEEEAPAEEEEAPAEEEQQQQEEAPAGQADATHAQYQHGVTAERRRWAQVLSSDPAEHRVEAATGLLVEALSAERIIAMLPRMPRDANTAALSLLSRTPQHNLRGNAADEGGADKGAASRKRALERHNKTIKGGVKGRAGPRTRKAAQGQEE